MAYPRFLHSACIAQVILPSQNSCMSFLTSASSVASSFRLKERHSTQRAGRRLSEFLACRAEFLGVAGSLWCHLKPNLVRSPREPLNKYLYR